jgi:hypothetical protein
MRKLHELPLIEIRPSGRHQAQEEWPSQKTETEGSYGSNCSSWKIGTVSTTDDANYLDGPIGDTTKLGLWSFAATVKILNMKAKGVNLFSNACMGTSFE